MGVMFQNVALHCMGPVGDSYSRAQRTINTIRLATTMCDPIDDLTNIYTTGLALFTPWIYATMVIISDLKVADQ